MTQVKEDFDRQFTDSRTRFLKDCDSQKAENDEEWAEVRNDWKAYNRERREALDTRRDRGEGQERGQGLGGGRGRGLTPE